MILLATINVCLHSLNLPIAPGTMAFHSDTGVGRWPPAPPQSSHLVTSWDEPLGIHPFRSQPTRSGWGSTPGLTNQSLLSTWSQGLVHRWAHDKLVQSEQISTPLQEWVERLHSFPLDLMLRGLHPQGSHLASSWNLRLKPHSRRQSWDPDWKQV